MSVISKQFKLIEMSNKRYVFKHFINIGNIPVYDRSHVIHSTVEVLLRQMSNHQYISSLCLGAMLAHSSGVGVRHAFMVE